MDKVKGEAENDIRCKSCGKLLAKHKKEIKNFEVKCVRCGTLNIIFSDNKDQMVLTDPEGTILYANELLEFITGYKIQEVIGEKPSLWGGLMSKEFYQEMWHTIKEERRSIQVTVTNKTKNGEKYNALLRISPILDTEGNIKFFIGIETLINKHENSTYS